MFRFAFLAVLCLPTAAYAQFVYPKPEYNRHDPGVYVEDPFIVKYRHLFFSVFKGDVATFEKADAEIEAMVRKNPKDARAMVWKGNGETIKALMALFHGQKEEAKRLADESRHTLDAAVSLSPNDPNIYMMQVATLYTQGQYLPATMIPRSNWTELRDDCQKFIEFVGPQRMTKVSVHVRGEAYGEMGIADLRLGYTQDAKAAFQKVIELDPGTDYETRAKREIAKL